MLAFSMRKELRGIMPRGAPARPGSKRANKKVVKVLGGEGGDGAFGGGRGQGERGR